MKRDPIIGVFEAYIALFDLKNVIIAKTNPFFEINLYNLNLLPRP